MAYGLTFYILHGVLVSWEAPFFSSFFFFFGSPDHLGRLFAYRYQCSFLRPFGYSATHILLRSCAKSVLSICMRALLRCKQAAANKYNRHLSVLRLTFAVYQSRILRETWASHTNQCIGNGFVHFALIIYRGSLPRLVVASACLHCRVEIPLIIMIAALGP